MKYFFITIYVLIIFFKYFPKYWFNVKIFVLKYLKEKFHSNSSVLLFANKHIHATMYNNSDYFKTEIDFELKKFIAQNCSFYQGLNDELKIDFLQRIQNFINDKTFQSYDNCAFGKNEIYTVSYHAIMLSFGLSNYLYDEFDEIFIGENSLSSNSYDKKIAGLTSTQGYMFFSKKAITDSLKNPKDGYNILFHEFAHGLCIQGLLSGDDILNDTLFKRWMKSCSDYLDDIEEGKKQFLRDYALTNYQEFFAVSVESFFERSMEYQLHFPEHYHSMSVLLNQDVLKASNPLLISRSRYNGS